MMQLWTVSDFVAIFNVGFIVDFRQKESGWDHIGTGLNVGWVAYLWGSHEDQVKIIWWGGIDFSGTVEYLSVWLNMLSLGLFWWPTPKKIK